MPIPSIGELLDATKGFSWFSTIDLKSAYWQVEIAPEDKEKTAFCIGNELWQFKVLPFDLCNAPATFVRVMNSVLKGLIWKICLVYLDDILVLSKSFTEHLQHL